MLTVLKQGYAQLLDTPVEALTTPGLQVVVTPKRDQPEWANWVHPIWFSRATTASFALCRQSTRPGQSR